MTGILLAAGICLCALGGCGESEGVGTKVVLTTGFNKDEIFRIETSACTLPEIMVYLTNIQNRYESVYGTEIWNTNVDGVTLEQNVKDIALAQIAQIKTMNLMAGRYEVELSDEEKAQAENAANAYYRSLNSTEIELMGVSENSRSIASAYSGLTGFAGTSVSTVEVAWAALASRRSRRRRAAVARFFMLATMSCRAWGASAWSSYCSMASLSSFMSSRQALRT